MKQGAYILNILFTFVCVCVRACVCVRVRVFVYVRAFINVNNVDTIQPNVHPR